MVERLSPYVLIVAIAGLSGCTSQSGPAKKVCYPVKGELLVKDKPAGGAMVVFRPKGDANPADWISGFPRAHVQEDGKFDVGTYTDNDGAPAGDYVLLVTWPAPNPQNEEAASTDRLSGRYANPDSSKLTAKVEPHPTELAPIRLP